jgi:hypothetical protein
MKAGTVIGARGLVLGPRRVKRRRRYAASPIERQVYFPLPGMIAWSFFYRIVR